METHDSTLERDEPSPEADRSEVEAVAAPPPSRRPRVPPAGVVSGLAALATGAVVFLLMASERNFGFSVPLAFACLGGCAGSLLYAFRILPRGSVPGAFPLDLATLWKPSATLLGLVVALFFSLRVCVSGHFAWLSPPGVDREVMQSLASGVVVTSLFLGVIVGMFRLLQRAGIYDSMPLQRREGFWMLFVGTLLYLPMLGNFGLIDPWETHYGEVAREILNRDDWISLWWAHEGWFMSKPILSFWIEALSFSALGVPYGADQMLLGVTRGLVPQPEWAARFPVFLMTMVATYAIYRSTVPAFGRRASFLGCVVLLTTPHWFFLSHQTMVDMPYVATSFAALCCIVLAFQADPEARLRTYELRIGGRTLSFNLMHVLVAVVLMCALPQVLYLASRHVTLRFMYPPFRLHMDEIFAGSPGSCDVVGNKSCHDAAHQNPQMQPWLVALGALASAVAFVFVNRREDRTRRFLLVAAWFLTSLSFMAKGAPGLVLPVAAAIAYLAINYRFAELRRLEWGSFALLFSCVAAPWFVQMYLRHGSWFIDRLFTHHMVKRAFDHVHDTNVGDDTSFTYYVWQLGYALFPWTGLCAAGLLWWRRREDVGDAARTAVQLNLMWFIAGFGMLTVSGTKFHHYILPLVPALCVLCGLVMGRLWGEVTFPTPSRRWLYYVVQVLAAVLLVYGASCLFPGSILGTVQAEGAVRPRSLAVGIPTLLVGLSLAVAVPWVARARSTLDVVEDAHGRKVLGFFAIASAIVVAVVGRDMFVTLPGDVEGQMRLFHLFCYKYERPWPAALDFRGVLAAFTLVMALASLPMFVPRLRPHASRSFVALACVWCVWGLDVYFVRAAPHWSQRQNLLVYYRERASADEPFVAYQMNWKGENFYTGNHVPIWVRTGDEFKDWVAEEREKGHRVMYFTSEHSREKNMRRELGDPEDYEVLVDESQDNKFFVARVRFDDEIPPRRGKKKNADADEE